MKYTFLIILMAVLCTPAFSTSETDPTGSPTPNSLPQQYKNLKTDLEIIDGFRMIKMYTMDRFWKVVEDTLLVQKSKIRESAAVIAKQKEEMGGLNASLKKIEQEKQDLQTRVDGIVVWGKVYSKAGVISVAAIIIIGLVVLSGALFTIGRVSRYTARELRKLNESLYLEFDTYKRNTVEKEIKISRELQNYRNRLEELKTA